MSFGQFIAGQDEFVTGGKNADDRLLPDRDFRMVHGSCQRQALGVDDTCSLQQCLAFGEIETCRAHEPAFFGRFEDSHGIAVADGVFLDDDGVGALRHRRAGEDAHGGSGHHLARKGVACCRFADHRKRGFAVVQVRMADGVAIHGGSRKGRLGAFC